MGLEYQLSSSIFYMLPHRALFLSIHGSTLLTFKRLGKFVEVRQGANHPERKKNRWNLKTCCKMQLSTLWHRIRASESQGQSPTPSLGVQRLPSVWRFGRFCFRVFQLKVLIGEEWVYNPIDLNLPCHFLILGHKHSVIYTTFYPSSTSKNVKCLVTSKKNSVTILDTNIYHDTFSSNNLKYCNSLVLCSILKLFHIHCPKYWNRKLYNYFGVSFMLV